MNTTLEELHLKLIVPIEEVYPQFKGQDHFYGPGDYQPLLNSLEYTIAVQETEPDYQGDTWLLLRDTEGDRWGYLCFGWGSCSGCDALQACETYQDIDALRRKLYHDIRWDTKAGLLAWLNEHDWEGDFSSKPEYFLAAAKAVLST